MFCETFVEDKAGGKFSLLVAINESTPVLSNSGDCLTFEVSDELSSETHWFPHYILVGNSSVSTPAGERPVAPSNRVQMFRHRFRFTFFRSFLYIVFDLVLLQTQLLPRNSVALDYDCCNPIREDCSVMEHSINSQR